MNLDNIKWTLESYDEFINYLFSIKDEVYAKFNFKKSLFAYGC